MVFPGLRLPHHHQIPVQKRPFFHISRRSSQDYNPSPLQSKSDLAVFCVQPDQTSLEENTEWHLALPMPTRYLLSDCLFLHPLPENDHFRYRIMFHPRHNPIAFPYLLFCASVVYIWPVPLFPAQILPYIPDNEGRFPQ